MVDDGLADTLEEVPHPVNALPITTIDISTTDNFGKLYMGQLPLNLIKAARVQGAGEIVVLHKIILPLVAGSAIFTFFMTFTKIIFELPASMLLYPPGNPTFSVTIQHYFSESHWSKGSALSVIGLLILLAAYSLGRYLMEHFSKGKGLEEKPELECQEDSGSGWQ